ncbi:hypothetical protein HGB07_04580 [Candidatus Roizmanbacteria bacterium]|nr:hypothetical protein [Candidatus Roizmanbacteria bacterium]
MAAEFDVHGNVELTTESVLENAIKDKPVPSHAAGIDFSGLHALQSMGKKIDAIKLYREQAGVGLKDANDAIDAIERGDV